MPFPTLRSGQDSSWSWASLLHFLPCFGSVPSIAILLVVEGCEIFFQTYYCNGSKSASICRGIRPGKLKIIATGSKGIGPGKVENDSNFMWCSLSVLVFYLWIMWLFITKTHFADIFSTAICRLIMDYCPTHQVRGSPFFLAAKKQ